MLTISTRPLLSDGAGKRLPSFPQLRLSPFNWDCRSSRHRFQSAVGVSSQFDLSRSESALLAFDNPGRTVSSYPCTWRSSALDKITLCCTCQRYTSLPWLIWVKMGRRTQTMFTGIRNPTTKKIGRRSACYRTNALGWSVIHSFSAFLNLNIL